VLKDISLLDKSNQKTSSAIDLKSAKQTENTKVLMYIGNLESYQGCDLMLEGFAKALTGESDLLLAVVGGEQQHIAYYQGRAEQLGVADKVRFLGKQPVSDLYALMRQADILLSPRISGVNTPMKVYSYLDSGVPVLATRLPTHTQVMTDKNTCLVEPTPEAWAEGILQLVEGGEKVRQQVDCASAFIRAEHSLTAFKAKVQYIYQLIS
jgi:glycosyltransferase involved in cell wall biosynthesis